MQALHSCLLLISVVYRLCNLLVCVKTRALGHQIFLIQAEDNSNSFHDFYMEMVTSNFGDDLDHLRRVCTSVTSLFVITF